MKTYILAALIVVTLFSCDTKEKERLQVKVDSLSQELTASKKVEAQMNEVGILIDSIDASRKAMEVQMIEGKTTYADYISRLKTINNYVKQTEAKLAQLETASNTSRKASAATIRRLKNDLEKSTKEIVALQLQLATVRNENNSLWQKVNSKDSILSINDQVIKLQKSDIASMEKAIEDTNVENKNTVANLYYAQAEALEEAANRTHFAPRKKKETINEALELYRLSLTLGKDEAKSKIAELEKKVS
ncbi:MAG: hypothetical protein KF860_13660 [Cyclobacteriaceae bacterium]|nr:hypothetical protein [Cyclobacteriaceae bacterium]